MAKIKMTRPHQLGKEKALAAGIKVAEVLKSKAQIDYSVEGDVINVKRTGAKGSIRVTETDVTAEVEIGLVLRPMKGLIESKMGEYLERYLKLEA